MEQVIVESLYPDTKLPVRATAHSAGMDVCAYLRDRTVTRFTHAKQSTVYDGSVVYDTVQGAEKIAVNIELTLPPNSRAAIPLGFKAQLPEGWEAQVRTRSGLALKQGLVVANSPGTIDADYPDEWMVILHNTSAVPVTVTHGDRVAQIVLAQLSPALPWTPGQVGQTTDRTGGFGSTGR